MTSLGIFISIGDENIFGRRYGRVGVDSNVAALRCGGGDGIADGAIGVF